MICCFINIVALMYGAVWDYKHREIPNAVPITLMLTGLLSGWQCIGYRALCLLFAAMAFLIASYLTNKETPGGDFKLLGALFFSAGFYEATLTLFLTMALIVLESAVRKKSLHRHIPLCTYLAPAYLTCIMSDILLFF